MLTVMRCATWLFAVSFMTTSPLGTVNAHLKGTISHDDRDDAMDFSDEPRELQSFTGAVTGLELISVVPGPTPDTKLKDLVNGDVIVATTSPSFNINAVVTGNGIGSVGFGYNSTTVFKIENNAAYAFCGNVGPSYNQCPILGYGTHVVTATAYSGSNLTGIAGTPFQLAFRIVRPAPTFTGKVERLELINVVPGPAPDTKLLDLVDGGIVKSDAPSFNINAVVSGTGIGSVVFGHNQVPIFKIENTAAYAFCGNVGPSFNQCMVLGYGSHTITATPYSATNGNGTAGTPLQLTFEIAKPSCPELDYINRATHTGRTLTLTGTTPEDRAAQWICNDDPMIYDLNRYEDLFRLMRRYALLCVWYQKPSNTAATLTNGFVDECDGWKGVGCELGLVRRVVYPSNNLGGTIPPDVAHLGTIFVLDLSNNGLTGPLPQSLGDLIALEQIDLSNNALTGPIPESVSSWNQIFFVDLRNNLLNGNIPVAVENWYNIKFAHFEDNNFVGTVPNGICNFKPMELAVDCAEVKCRCCTNCACRALDIINSQTYAGRTITVAGATPEDRAAQWICSDDPLTYDLNNHDDQRRLMQRYALLCLWYQNPSNIAATLTKGFVDECRWTGATCDDIGPLRQVTYASSNLGGTIPPDVAHLETILILDLSNNGFTGPLPPSLGDLTMLEQIDLSNNALTGPIPQSVRTWRRIFYVDLRTNLLNGNIPVAVENWYSIQYAHFEDNNFVGTMPNLICNFKPVELAVDCAEVKCRCCTNCACRALDIINSQTYTGRTLSLTGTTPEDRAAQWICSDDPLTYDFNNNGDQMRLLSRYAVLCLWYQKPSNMAETLTLGENHECDWLGIGCDRYGFLRSVDLALYKLGGTIPPDVGLITFSIQYLSLAENDFTGQIPETISNLYGLQLFDVSYNMLTGSIPLVTTWDGPTRFFVNNNQLTGKIPRLVAEWDDLVDFHVNDNMLSGTIPSGVENWAEIRFAHFENNDLGGTMPNGICDFNFNVLEVDCNEVSCACCTNCS